MTFQSLLGLRAANCNANQVEIERVVSRTRRARSARHRRGRACASRCVTRYRALSGR